MEPKKKILIVDDEPELCKLVKVVLEDGGFDVITVNNPSDTVNVIENTGIPDLVILDVVMPELSGWDVCDLIKSNSETSNIPIMFLTVNADSRDVEKGFGLGAGSYMCKPFRPMELLQRVSKLLETI